MSVEDDNPLVSPGRPRQSVSSSPAALLQPDPPPTDEVLNGASDQLRNIMTNYDEENGTDTAGAMEKAVAMLKGYVWNPQALKFYFGQIEIKMKASGVKKQFTKLQVLSTILPVEVMMEVRPILEKQESEFENNDSYLQIKTELFRIFGPSEEEAFERAMGRVLSGKPSTLARALVNDLCDHQLDGCCCRKFIFGLWHRALPTSVRQGITHMEFNAATFKNICKLADDLYEQGKPSGASMAAVQPEVFETAFHQDFQSVQGTAAEVAAVQYGRGRGQARGGRGGRGGRQHRGGGRRTNNSRPQQGQSGQSGTQAEWSAANPRWKGPRHPDMPPFSSCRKHWDWGKSARFCQEPWACPWKSFYSQPANNKNQ